MKKLVIFALSLFCFALYASAQSDVLYLKNGSRIKGSVLEMDPTNGVKIQTSDGSLFVYSMSEVDHVSKDNWYGNSIPDRKIGRHKANFYWEDTGKKLTNDEYASILDDELYDTYCSARKQFKRGRRQLFTGLVFTAVAIACYDSYLNSGYYISHTKFYDQSKYDAFVLTGGLADLFFCLGFIHKGIGKGRLNWVKDTYNSGRSYSSTVNFAPSLMMTAQQDFGLGATLSITF